MQNLKSDAATDLNGLDNVESFDAAAGAEVIKPYVGDSPKSTKNNKIDLEEAKKTRAKKAAPRKRRSTKAKKNVDAAAVAEDANNVVVSRQDVDDISDDDDNELDFSVEEEQAAVVAKKRRGHHHENGVLCDFCKLNDKDFAAAYAMLKQNDVRRKHAAEVKLDEAVLPPVFRAAEEEQKPRVSKKLLYGVGVAVALAVAAFLWNEESNYTRATSLTDLGRRAYVTADHTGSIKFLHNAVTLSTDEGTTVAKAKIWQDNWHDQMALAFGAPENTLWLKAVPSGFKAQDGTVFYAPDSSEIKTINTMNALRDGAEKMFQTQGRYPQNQAELEAACSAGSIKDSKIGMTSEVGPTLVTGQGETSFEHALKGGQLFGREKGAPNLITVLEIKSEPSISSDFNSYGWKTNALFIHGFDSKGNLISGSNGNPVMLVGMKNGKRINVVPEKTAARPEKPTSVWLYDGDMPNQGGIKFGFIAAAFLAILTVAVAIGKRLHDNVMDH